MSPATAVILAAGAGSRFGANKLTALVEGRPLVSYAIDAACSSHALNCVLVLGADADTVLERADTRRCAIVRNERWRDGIASSIRAGIAHAKEADSCLFLLGDQPFVSAADLDALMDRHASGNAKGRPRLRGRAGAQTLPTIVALRTGGVWGAPMLFPRRDFAPLSRLTGDRGAKRYAQTQARRLTFVAARDRRAFADIDTCADLRSIASGDVG